MKKTINMIMVLLFFPLAGFAQLPTNYQLDQDWLLDASPFKAQILIDKDEVVLSNGLIRRTILLKPSATTIRYENLMTGNSIIRAVNPEAEVTIDQITYPVGGLVGQKNRAFLRDEWIAELAPPQNALELVGIKQGVPQERFPWKRTRHAAPNVQWPPKGVYLRMDYKRAAISTNRERLLLLKDDFSGMDAAWKIHASKQHERSSFENEGKAGEIYTPANTAVFAERKLPADARLVELVVHPGEDRSGMYGPGMALVWPERVVRFYIKTSPKPGAARFAVWTGSTVVVPKSPVNPDQTKWVKMRMRWDAGRVYCEAQAKDSSWKLVTTIRTGMEGNPSTVRIGKMDQQGGGKDLRNTGELVRLKIRQVAIYGAANKSALSEKTLSLGKKDEVVVSVHYELYDGIPLMSKWITVRNGGKEAINIDRFRAEDLSVVEYDNSVGNRANDLGIPDMLHVETDMAFGGFTTKNANHHTVHWRAEKNYRSQVNWKCDMPCHLVVEPTYGPDQTVKPGDTFESFRVFELVYDSGDRERRGLALKQMYRTIAPWVTENPLMMHMRSSKEEIVRRGIDQCDAVGFELLILSFGSGFQTESTDTAYLSRWKKIADYAHSKGIHIGSYSLLSSRAVKPDSNMIVSPEGMRPTHGRCPALTSTWGQEYFRALRNLFEKTGFDFFEHDGSYPGDVDVTPRPPLQKGINDSRWAQWRVITEFYQWLLGRGGYMNVPDFYYLSGANKCGMGYREVNWAMPRAQQLIHTRQNIYDGTWEKTPSMGWMFVPLTGYQGGGAAATIEPLEEHLDHYEAMMRSNLGMGVQACYRGPRLFDTDRTRDMLKRVVAWYKSHRDILESDMIHGRRADGRDLDWMLHVNPYLKEKGYLSVYNPTDREITKILRVPLYYTGLNGTAIIQKEGDTPSVVTMDADRTVRMKITVPPQGFCGYLITDPEEK